ncbi:MAG: MOSC domain-containing protein [Dongiaceae bacterium]
MAEAGDEIGRIAEIWRYPVQSMRGEALGAADIAAGGVVGDRRYGVVDPEAGMVVSSAQGRRKWRAIVTLAARYLEAPNVRVCPPVEILLPDGSRLRNDQRDIDERLAAALGAPVHLADKAAEEKRSEYSHSPLHVLTTASLRQFAEHHPEGRFVPARFRPNIVIDTGDRIGFLEQGWLERRFAIGDGVEIAIAAHCKRCVMTTLPQGDLPLDPAILHTATAHNNTHAGVYATVLRPGSIKVGDPVRALG